MINVSTPLVLTPLVDACINSNQPNAVLNKQGLGIGKWSYINRSLLKFDPKGLRMLANKINSVELRLYGKAQYPPVTVNAIFTGNNFNEQLVTWATQPAPSRLNGKSLMGFTSNIPTSLGWFSIDRSDVFNCQIG